MVNVSPMHSFAESCWTLVDFTEISTVYMHIHTNTTLKLQIKEDNLMGGKKKVRVFVSSGCHNKIPQTG